MNEDRTVSAIAPHAGEHHTHGRAFITPNHRGHRHINRRAHAVHGGVLVEGNPPVHINCQMKAAGRDQSPAHFQRVARLGLFNRQRRNVIEPFGERVGKANRHVLNDEHRRRQAGQQGRHHGVEGPGAAG